MLLCNCFVAISCLLDYQNAKVFSEPCFEDLANKLCITIDASAFEKKKDEDGLCPK